MLFREITTTFPQKYAKFVGITHKFLNVNMVLHVVTTDAEGAHNNELECNVRAFYSNYDSCRSDRHHSQDSNYTAYRDKTRKGSKVN